MPAGRQRREAAAGYLLREKLSVHFISSLRGRSVWPSTCIRLGVFRDQEILLVAMSMRQRREYSVGIVGRSLGAATNDDERRAPLTDAR